MGNWVRVLHGVFTVSGRSQATIHRCRYPLYLDYSWIDRTKSSGIWLIDHVTRAAHDVVEQFGSVCVDVMSCVAHDLHTSRSS